MILYRLYEHNLTEDDVAYNNEIFIKYILYVNFKKRE